MRVFPCSVSISDWLIELGLQREFIAISILIIFMYFAKNLIALIYHPELTILKENEVNIDQESKLK